MRDGVAQMLPRTSVWYSVAADSGWYENESAVKTWGLQACDRLNFQEQNKSGIWSKNIALRSASEDSFPILCLGGEWYCNGILQVEVGEPPAVLPSLF